MRSSATVFFDSRGVAVATHQSFGGFGGMKSLDLLMADSSNEELAQAVRKAWAGKTSVEEYDAAALTESWLPVCDYFGVDRHSVAPSVTVSCVGSEISAIPSEWKGDNRVRRSDDRIDLPAEVSDIELGAAIRRAMELTTS